MSDLIGSVSSIIALLVGVAVWAILFVVILEALKKSSPFASWTCYVMAGCVSLLSVIAMSRMLGGSAPLAQGAGDDGIPWLILLPYAAMGIAMLVMPLLLSLRKRARRTTTRPPTREFHLRGTSEENQTAERPALPNHPGRGK